MLYIRPSPPPNVEGTDGLCTEIEYLREFFNGSTINLSPFRYIPPGIPVKFYGLQHWFKACKMNEDFRIVHIFFPYLANFWILRNISTPIIYTVTSGINVSELPRVSLPFPKVVCSNNEADILRSRGITNVHVIRPGIDLSRFESIPSETPDGPFTIIAGSAPWTRDQFETKGFNLLLQVLYRIPELRLVCLWRGVLHDEWSDKVEGAGLDDRVKIINQKVDITQILPHCHAAIVLASRHNEVKSYPNSLMEALASGRPVLVSRIIPISEYIEENDLGKVIEKLSLEELVRVIRELIDQYNFFRCAVEQRRGSDLSVIRMIEDYGALYRKAIE